MKRETTDVLVIGAGPAGAIAASIMNKNGLKVKVVEKQKFPRFVIGESLLPRCMDHFEEAGFLQTLKKQGYQEKKGAIFLKENKRCEFEFSEQYTKGWEWTWQVPRAHFDKVMTDELDKMGVNVDFEKTVIDINFHDSDSVTLVRDKVGEECEIEAKFIIDASGYGRVIPRLLDLNIPSKFPPRATIFTQIKDKNRPAGKDSEKIMVVAHRQDIWIWIIPFSDGNTSVGVVGSPAFFEEFAGSQEEKLRAILASQYHTQERFAEVEMLFSPISIKGYAIGVKQLYGNGYVLTGNAMEFLDPIFSPGVAFATESGCIAAKLACRQLRGEKVDWEKEYVDIIKHGEKVFRSYIKGWYDGTIHKIFFADKQTQSSKNMICSVLAGYVWDMSNPYAAKHHKAISTLARVIEIQSA